MVKKIALVGTSESSVKLADGLDDSWQVWGCNAVYQMISGVDVHFELHTIPYLEGLGIIPEYLEYMAFKGKNLILAEPCDKFPEAQIYPIKEILKFFDMEEKPYFNNTIAYMIAAAIWNNPDLEELALFGIDMAAITEYAHQRPCTEFYLGWARAKGIKLIIPKICPILKTTHLYGIEEPPTYITIARQQAKEDDIQVLKYARERETALVNDAYARGLRDRSKILLQLNP